MTPTLSLPLAGEGRAAARRRFASCRQCQLPPPPERGGRSRSDREGVNMTHHVLDMPITEAQVRALKVGDTVTLERTLFGIRDATLIHMFDRGRTTRLDLKGHAVIHTAPNVRKVDARRRVRPAMRRSASAPPPRSAWSASPAADGARRRAHHHRQGRHGAGHARGVPRSRRRVSRDRRRRGGARDHLDRGDRGRRHGRPASRKPVALPHQGFRAADGGDGLARRLAVRARQRGRRRQRAAILASIGAAE